MLKYLYIRIVSQHRSSSKLYKCACAFSAPCSARGRASAAARSHIQTECAPGAAPLAPTARHGASITSRCRVLCATEQESKVSITTRVVGHVLSVQVSFIACTAAWRQIACSMVRLHLHLELPQFTGVAATVSGGLTAISALTKLSGRFPAFFREGKQGQG